MPIMFRDFPEIERPAFTCGRGWEDNSYSNDVTAHAIWSPSGHHTRDLEQPCLEAWIEPEAKKDRNPGAARYLIRWLNHAGDIGTELFTVLYEGDDIECAQVAAKVAITVATAR